MGYVEVDELAAYLSIEDDGDDADLDIALASATDDIDKHCGWGANGFAKTDTTVERFFGAAHIAAEDRCLIRLDRGLHRDSEVATDLTIKTDDTADGSFGTTWAETDFELLPLNNYFAGVDGFPFFEIRAVGSKSWPTHTTRSASISVEALWTWSATPSVVKTVSLQRAAALHRRRRTQDGIQPETGFRAGGRDRDWAVLLNEYRHPRKLAGIA